MVIGLLSALPENKALPPSRVLMPAGFAANHPLVPFNTALQYGITVAVLQAAGVSAKVNLIKFFIVNLILSLGFLGWSLLASKILPDHPISNQEDDESQSSNSQGQEAETSRLTRKQELVTYFSFALAVAGMVSQSYIGDAGYAMTGIAVIPIFLVGVLDFTEIRDAISAPIILMSAGVIGVADALGSTGLTQLVGKSVAGMFGSSISPFLLIFVFCVLTSLLATLTGSTLGTVYVFAPLAIATCTHLGFNPTAAAAAIIISGWCGHFLPVDGMPALIMGTGNYSMVEFWKFTIPQYFIRLLALTAGALILFPV